MKIRIAISLAVLGLVAFALINKSAANTTNAPRLPASNAELKGTTTPAEPPTAGFGATCFCKVTANGTEVARVDMSNHSRQRRAGIIVGGYGIPLAILRRA